MHDSIRDLAVEAVPVSVLKGYHGNARTHSKKQIAQIADLICTFSWTNPILIDADGGVIAGHGRLEAAKILGLNRVPVIRISDMSEAQKRAYILADNRLAELAGWDREILAIELQVLLDMDRSFEITTTGFEIGEIDLIIGADAGGPAEEAEIEEPDPAGEEVQIRTDRPAENALAEKAEMGRRRSPNELRD